jgi:hypothetical protein
MMPLTPRRRAGRTGKAGEMGLTKSIFVVYNVFTDQSTTRASCFTASCITAYFYARTNPVVKTLATLIGSKADTTGLLL